MFGGASNKDPSEGFNTASGRRLSSGFASSFGTANNHSKIDILETGADEIQPLY